MRAVASLNLGYFLNISMNFLKIYTVNNSQCLQVRNANGSVTIHVAVKMMKMNGHGWHLLYCHLNTETDCTLVGPRMNVILFCFFFCKD